MIGSSVKITVHDPEGTPFTAEGTIQWIAASATAPYAAGQPPRWECLVVVDTVAGKRAVVFNVCDLEILDKNAPDAPDPVHDKLESLEQRVRALDEECAGLTAQLKRAESARHELASENAELKKLGKVKQPTGQAVTK